MKNTRGVIPEKAVKIFFGLLHSFINNSYADYRLGEKYFLPLFYLSKIHSLSPVLYYMLKNTQNNLAEKYPEEFSALKQDYMISVARFLQQQASLEEIQDTFKQNNVRILFFKGAQIRMFYPVPELRTMGDMDCLITEKDRRKADELMLQLGYVREQAEGDVWVYRRGMSIIEMHTRMAANSISNHFDYARFFQDAMEHGVEENGNLYLEKEYHFCFLIYHIAKHLSSTGAGVRMFLDILVFLQHYGEEFDRDKAETLLKEASLDGTAAAVFGLCDRWFGSSLSRENPVPQDVLDELETYVIHGGTFGFETHDIGDVYKRKAHTDRNKDGGIFYRLRLLRDYLFPPLDYMRRFVPMVVSHRWMLPIAWIKRWWIGVFQRRKKTLNTIKSMAKDEEERSYREYLMLKKIGL